MSNKEQLMQQFGVAEEKKAEKAAVNTAEEELIPLAAKTNTHEHGKSSRARKKAKKKKKFIKAVHSIFTDKTLSKMLNVFLFCLIANGVEYFIIINHMQLDTKGVVSKIAGILIILGYMYSDRLKPQNVGFSANPKSVTSAIRNAFVFNLAIIPAYVLEFVWLLINGKKPVISVFAYDYPLPAAFTLRSVLLWLAGIMLLIIINIVSVAMLEILFRGILLKMGKNKFGFWQTAIILSTFYSLWYLIIPLSKIVSGHVSPTRILILCIFYLVFEFSLSLKWCMCVRATGSIWLALFDHLFFNVFVDLIHINSQSYGMDTNKYVRLIIIQVISFALCFSYYKMKMHKKERLMQAVGIRSIYAFDSLADMSEDDISRQAERIKTTDGDIDSEYLNLLKKNEIERRHHR